MTENTIVVRGLRRSYGSGHGAFDAVRGIDLSVAAGTIHALLGTNGAGKTSTLEVIEGLARPTGGGCRRRARCSRLAVARWPKRTGSRCRNPARDRQRVRHPGGFD